MKRIATVMLLALSLAAIEGCSGCDKKSATTSKRDPNVCYCDKDPGGSAPTTKAPPATPAPLDVDSLITAYAKAVRKTVASEAENNRLRQMDAEVLKVLFAAQSEMLKAANEYGELGASAAESTAAEQDQIFTKARAAWKSYQAAKANLEERDKQSRASTKARNEANWAVGSSSHAEELARTDYTVPLMEDPNADAAKHFSRFSDGRRAWAAESQWVSRQRGMGDGKGFAEAGKKYQAAFEEMNRCYLDGAAAEKIYQEASSADEAARAAWSAALKAVMEDKSGGQSGYALASKTRRTYLEAHNVYLTKQAVFRTAENRFSKARDIYDGALRQAILQSD